MRADDTVAGCCLVLWLVFAVALNLGARKSKTVKPKFSRSQEVDTIEKGDVFVHLESGLQVVVVNTGLMKVAEDSGPTTWVGAVSYQHPGGENPERVFTRSRISFHTNFRRA